jgi:RNA polymerase sigma factor (sigma-70 family)
MTTRIIESQVAETTQENNTDKTRARRLMLYESDFIHNPEFEITALHQEFLACDESGRLPDEPSAARMPKRPANIPSYFASLYETPLLTQEEECRAFRLLNFCKYQANVLRTAIDPDLPDLALLDEIERLHERALQTRNALSTANLRLVVSIARRFSHSADEFDEFVGEGNLNLFQAIDKFDYGRGFRFSTYATHAIQRGYYRLARSRQIDASRAANIPDNMLAEMVSGEPVAEPTFDRTAILNELFKSAGDELNERERNILSARFAIGGSDGPRSLSDLAKDYGLSKERVRQVQWRAIEKLRLFAIE